MAQTKSYFGFLMQQREVDDAPKCFVFAAPAVEIDKWAGIVRTSDEPRGIQRVAKSSRVTAIARFMNKAPTNVIPTSLLLAFEPGVATFTSDAGVVQPNECGTRLRWGKITFQFEPGGPERERPALVVDGQHRLKGLMKVNGGQVPVVAVCLLAAPRHEQAFQFVVINQKAQRVPTPNVKSILADFNEAELHDRLLLAGITYDKVVPMHQVLDTLDTSPFKQMLNWDANRHPGARPVVELTALEQMQRTLRDEMSEAVGEDEDALLAVMCAIWAAVKVRWPAEWAKDNSLLFKKVSMVALNGLLVAELNREWLFADLDAFNLPEIETRVGRMLKDIPEEFWRTDLWKIQIQDNRVIRDIISKSLVAVISNIKHRRPWHQDVPAYSAAAEEA